MKKILLIALGSFLVLSCSIGDDVSNNFNLLPIDEVDVPATFKVDSISIFKIRYKRETDCQIYDGIYFNTVGDTSKIAIKIVELNENGCNPDGETVYEIPLYFKPTESGTYIFNFWNGKDSNGENLYTNSQIIVP